MPSGSGHRALGWIVACLALLIAFVLPGLTPPRGSLPGPPRPERSEAPPTLTGPAMEGSNRGDASEGAASSADAAIHVQVVARDRIEPLAGVRLRFGSERSHDEAAASAEESTGADGIATFRGRESGFVTVTDPAWMTERGVVPVLAGRWNVLEVQRRRNMSVCLRAPEGGGGVPGWSVSPLGLGTGVGTTGPDGTALLARQEFPPRILSSGTAARSCTATSSIGTARPTCGWTCPPRSSRPCCS